MYAIAVRSQLSNLLDYRRVAGICHSNSCHIRPFAYQSRTRHCLRRASWPKRGLHPWCWSCRGRMGWSHPRWRSSLQLVTAKFQAITLTLTRATLKVEHGKLAWKWHVGKRCMKCLETWSNVINLMNVYVIRILICNQPEMEIAGKCINTQFVW